MISAFTIPGQPIPKGRHRTTIRRGRVTTRTPERTVTFETVVGANAWKACRGIPWDHDGGPLAVDIVAVLGRVGRLDKIARGRVWGHGSTVDADNVAKAVLDGMQRGGALANDRHVVDVRCRLVYAAAGEKAHTEVTVRSVLPGDL